MYALVTGGSRGIGRAISIQLAQLGYTVLINYLSNEKAAQETLACIQEHGGQGELLPFDVCDNQAAAAALTQWQAQHPEDYIAVLINNAGIRRDNLLVWMEEDDFEQVLRTNLFSIYNVTRPLLTPMIRHRHGRTAGNPYRPANAVNQTTNTFTSLGLNVNDVLPFWKHPVAPSSRFVHGLSPAAANSSVPSVSFFWNS